MDSPHTVKQSLHLPPGSSKEPAWQLFLQVSLTTAQKVLLPQFTNEELEH